MGHRKVRGGMAADIMAVAMDGSLREVAGEMDPAMQGCAMISHADVEKLRGLRAPGRSVLSLYLPVPLDPASLRTLATRADELIAAAHAADPDPMSAGPVSEADRDAVLDAVAAHGLDWLGQTVAIFVCADLGLFEALPLPCSLPERSVLATRPHVRPLLAALQRCPDYRVVVADRRHGWVAHHHYRDIAAILEQADAGDHEPLVIGGHQDAIGDLLRLLPPALREDFAGSFTGDPLTLTPARVRELAAPVIERWTARRERQLAEEVIDAAPGRLAAVGVPACLAAVNAGAAALLLVPDEGMVPGFECGRCGALSTSGDDCPDWGTATRMVPDLLEEMASRILDDGGQVVAVRDAPVSAAVRLRFPVPKGGDQ